MANVFGNGSTRNCSSGSGILPAPRPAIVPARSVSAAPKVFKGDAPTPEQLNPRDFYTRREIDRYLNDKAEISDVYKKTENYSSSEVDQLISQLNIASYATQSYVTSSISAQVNAINADLSSNYYERTSLYTRSEIDSIITAANIGDSYISKAPNSLSDITINPSINSLSVSLVVQSSNNTGTTQVQRWENSSTDFLGAIYADGKASFTNLTTIGANVNVGEVALDTSDRRISGVADPMNNLDAVNKSYMETFITTTIDDVLTDTDENYLVDAGQY